MAREGKLTVDIRTHSFAKQKAKTEAKIKTTVLYMNAVERCFFSPLVANY